MPRAIEQVFTEIERCLEWTVKMTYVEVYNETFRDLLSNSRKPISVLDNTNKSRGGTSLKGCTPTLVKSKSHAFHLLLKGQESRMVAAHAMNDRSSRSHAIVTLWIELTNDDGRRVKSKLNMVDLAGSERVRKTGTSGSMAKEATYINKSLSCLSLVAKELRRKALHVHYRDSKLTHYLKDSIGGNCRTLMIACIWADASNFGETLSTCRFADDIQNVEVTASKNSGIESVHGKLFKMNPAMAKYIEQMMEKRVAEEKAKMFRNLKKRGLLSTQTDDLDSFLHEQDLGSATESDTNELEALRRKIKILEQRQRSPASISESSHGQDPVVAVPELESLRQTVERLESEKKQVQDEMSKQMKDAECSLLEEMKDLRSKVAELQKLRALTHQECMELCALRERTAELANRSIPHGLDPLDSCDLRFQGTIFQPGPSQGKMDISFQLVNETRPPGAQGCWESVEQQARAVGELEGLRNRLRELHDIAVEKLSKGNFEEVHQIRNKIIDFQNDQALKNCVQTKLAPQRELSSDDGNPLEELECLKVRLKTLHSIPVDELKYDDLQELTYIKNKVSSLQNDDRIKSMTLSKDVGKMRLDKAEVMESYGDGDTLSKSSYFHAQKMSISSEFASSISVESPATVLVSSPIMEPTQKPAAPLKLHTVSITPSVSNGSVDEKLSETIVRRPLSPQRLLTRQTSVIPPFPGTELVKSARPQSSTKSLLRRKTGNTSISRPSAHSRHRSSKNPVRRMSSQLWTLVRSSKPGDEDDYHHSEIDRVWSFDESGDIAIMNALNHDELTDILRERYTSHQCLGLSVLSANHSFDSNLPYDVFP
eukprot:g2878.t1